MEHRLEERVRTAVPALVAVNKGAWATSTIREVSAGGLFVQTNTRLCRNAFVFVSICVNRGDTIGRHSFPAMVIHRQDDGVGLMFALPRERMTAAVRDLVAVGARLHERRRAARERSGASLVSSDAA